MKEGDHSFVTVRTAPRFTVISDGFGSSTQHRHVLPVLNAGVKDGFSTP
jgi:hypothetical protein